jgi:uncharacterized membrane protein YhiD involved in acid resistance
MKRTVSIIAVSATAALLAGIAFASDYGSETEMKQQQMQEKSSEQPQKMMEEQKKDVQEKMEQQMKKKGEEMKEDMQQKGGEKQPKTENMPE